MIKHFGDLSKLATIRNLEGRVDFITAKRDSVPIVTRSVSFEVAQSLVFRAEGPAFCLAHKGPNSLARFLEGPAH